MTVRLNFAIPAAAAYALRIGLAVLATLILLAPLPGEAALTRIPATGMCAEDRGPSATVVASIPAEAPDPDDVGTPTPWMPAVASQPSFVLRPGHGEPSAESIAGFVERPPRP